MAAAEISGADLPDQIAAVLAMIGTDAALPGIMREAALFGACVQCTHRVGAERAKAHRRDIEHRCRIWPGAFRTADADAEIFVGMRLRRHRMVHPFIALAIDILLGAERPLVEHHLRSLIDDRAGIAAERHAVLLALEEVLPHLRPDLFQQKAQMRRDRVVPQHSVALLREIANAEQRQGAENNDRDHNQIEHLVIDDSDTEKQYRDDAANRKNDEAWRERKHQRFHGTPRAGSAVLFLVGREPNPDYPNNLYTISGARVTGMTAPRLSNPLVRKQSIWRWAMFPSRVFCSAT